MRLIFRYNGLFAVDESGEFIGRVINESSGQCRDNPDQDEPEEFNHSFSGHGYIYHQSDSPPNPFFSHSWSDVFSNPELLPVGTRNVFVDQGREAESDFHAVETEPPSTVLGGIFHE